MNGDSRAQRAGHWRLHSREAFKAGEIELRGVEVYLDWITLLVRPVIQANVSVEGNVSSIIRRHDIGILYAHVGRTRIDIHSQCLPFGSFYF